MKRKGAATGRTPSITKFAAVTESRSSFTQCLVCGRSIALATANWHIDECLQAQPTAQQAATQLQQQQQQQQQQQLPQNEGSSAAPEPPLPAASPSVEVPQEREGQPPGTQQEQPQELEQPPPGRRPGKEPAVAPDPTPGGSKLAAPFLRTPKTERVVATGMRPPGSSGRAEEGLTAGGLFATAGCELLPCFLPTELAEQLLVQLQEDAPGWQQQTWWIGDRTDQPGLSSKTSCHYLLGEDGAPGSTAADADDGGYEGAEGQVPSLQAPEVVRLAAQMVAAAVSERIQGGQGWEPSYALANRYQGGGAGIAGHSDRLTKLGPCPIIASLTLGATRVFRLHRKQRLDLFGAGAGGSSMLHAAAAAGASMTRIDAPLPHNTLLIMWPPCQEAWKHEISKTAKPFPLHPKSGAVRFNLTFRRLKPEWVERAPRCACGRIAQMKARQPRELPPEGAPARELSYYYACDNSKGPSCNFWTPGATVRL